MQILKFIILVMIFLLSAFIGILISKRYSSRVFELKVIKNALNMLKTKIKFTYEPLPELFMQISENLQKNISEIFLNASLNMKKMSTKEAWDSSINSATLNLNNEDIGILKNLGKLLGKTDAEGQVSEIELTSSFIDMQIKKAEEERRKNEKMYRTLGTIIVCSSSHALPHTPRPFLIV